MAELVPRLSRLRPDWDVENLYAFAQPRGLAKVPFLCDLIAGFRLWRRAREADAVLVNGGEYAWILAFDPAFRDKTVIVWHGTRAFEIPALNPTLSVPLRIYWWLECRLQALALRFGRQIAVAPSVIDELRKTYGGPVAIEVVTNGAPQVDIPSGTAGAEAAFVVAWSGTNAYKKGLDLALAACRTARATIPNLELHVFGLPRGTEADEPWIRWHGSRPRAEALALVGRADAYLATTRYEACSMAALEAMALGTAIVGSPAIAWMLDETGTAVRDYDPVAFARALEQVRARRDTRAERKASARATLERFDWNRTAAAYVRTIQDVLAAASKRPQDV